ncbi:MAG: hypothetical protein HKN73_02030 [Gemmatimonadetes bacterium]|nr:hypothetical protein [Gemmatimonadota bacterium]
MGMGQSGHRSGRMLGVGALALVGCLGQQEIQGQAEVLGVADVREQFEQMARPGGFWATSNAEYATPESGEPNEYRMAFTLTSDGHSISGCMWGSPTPEGASPFWFFFHAWDPTTNSVLAYQSSPSGAVAIGREIRAADGGMESIQDLKFPGGENQRVRHLNRRVHPDTLASRSFDGSSTSEDEWEPRRSYTWIWRASQESNPC